MMMDDLKNNIELRLSHQTRDFNRIISVIIFMSCPAFSFRTTSHADGNEKQVAERVAQDNWRRPRGEGERRGGREKKEGKYGTFLCSSVVWRLSPGPLPPMGLSTDCKREAFVQRAFRRMLNAHIESGVECRVLEVRLD